jgi:hypothetical protein
MARRRRTPVGSDSLEELARKARILEHELAVQREALNKLKEMGSPRKHEREPVTPVARKTA